MPLKKKISFTHEHQVNSAFDSDDLKSSAKAIEDKIYEWYLNEINQGNFTPHLTELEKFINSFTLPFAVFFTVMYPIFAAQRIKETAEQLNLKDDLPVVAITPELKDQINQFAKKEATSHVNTIVTDIENALAEIRSKTSDPALIKSEFAEVFAKIQARRAQVISNNAAARIFTLSQYEADLQFLTRAGLLKKAYKELYSLTGDPCPICAFLIKQTSLEPIPFTHAFVNMGDEIEVDGLKMNFDFEKITAGSIHPNCRCVYRLIII